MATETCTAWGGSFGLWSCHLTQFHSALFGACNGRSWLFIVFLCSSCSIHDSMYLHHNCPSAILNSFIRDGHWQLTGTSTLTLLQERLPCIHWIIFGLASNGFTKHYITMSLAQEPQQRVTDRQQSQHSAEPDPSGYLMTLNTMQQKKF